MITARTFPSLIAFVVLGAILFFVVNVLGTIADVPEDCDPTGDKRCVVANYID